MGENVGVVTLCRGDALALFDVFESAKKVAIGGGLFELFFFSGGHHALFEAFHEVVPAAFEKEPDVAGSFAVALIGGETVDARAETTMNVILQTGTRMAAREIDRAARNEESLVNKMENAAGKSGGKIGAKIERAVFFDAAGEIDARIFFGGGEFNVRVGFVIPKHDVELRTVLLDEIVFERERFSFVADENGFEVGDFAGKRAGFCVDPARFEKIRADAAAERRSFPDIKHVARGVFE